MIVPPVHAMRAAETECLACGSPRALVNLDCDFAQLIAPSLWAIIWVRHAFANLSQHLMNILEGLVDAS